MCQYQDDGFFRRARKNNKILQHFKGKPKSIDENQENILKN